MTPVRHLRALRWVLPLLALAGHAEARQGTLDGMLAPEPPSPVAAPRERVVFINLSLLPAVSTNRLVGAPAHNRVSLGLGLDQVHRLTGLQAVALVGRTAQASRGVQVAGLASQAGDFRGLQVAGLLAASDPGLRGVQLSGVAAVSTTLHSNLFPGRRQEWIPGDTHGLQLGGIVALTENAVRGFQGGGVVAWSGDVTGAQVGGALAVGWSVTGVQAAAGLAASLSLKGVQVSGLVGDSRDLSGVQLAGLFATTNRGSGLQLAGVGASGYVTGLQLAGLYTSTSQLDGLQVAGLVNEALGAAPRGAHLGGQVALLNVSSDLRGFQVGLINVAEDVEGTQVGLLNIARSVDGTSLGLIHVLERNPGGMDVWGTELQPVSLAWRSGSGIVHGLVGAGVMRTRTPALAGLVGWGLDLPLSERLTLSPDLVYAQGVSMPAFHTEGRVAQLRVAVSTRLSDTLRVFAGATLNAGAFRGESPRALPELAHLDQGGRRWRVWPGAVLGIGHRPPPLEDELDGTEL